MTHKHKSVTQFSVYLYQIYDKRGWSTYLRKWGGGGGGAVLIFPFLNCGPIHLQWLFENYQMNCK